MRASVLAITLSLGACVTTEPKAGVNAQDARAAESESLSRGGEVRIVLRWDPAQARTSRHIEGREFASPGELDAQMRLESEVATQAGHDLSIVIDADAAVPWDDVMETVNLCRRLRLTDITFVAPSELD